ncbi:MAG: bifunctional UDP-sugar hydrolase/5'-nucleotidase [Bryobacteraceae bacterium]
MLRRSFLSLWMGLALASASLHAQVPGGELKSLTILHSNDLHARLLPNDQDIGGFARIATLVRQQKANCKACLYLHAGDMVQGTPVSPIFRGTPVYRVANLIGLDVGTLGNHEFDYGWRRAKEFARVAKFPVVSANIVDASGKSITGQPYVIKTVDGIRVAIIGVTLSDLSGKFVTAGQVGPHKVLPVVETVRKYAAELRNQSDVIVVLGHIHDKEEVEAILKNVPDVAVVVAGHTHEGYPKMMDIDGRVAVLVNSYGRELGRLDLKLDVAARKVRSAEWIKIPLDSRIPLDPKVQAAAKSWEDKVSKIVDKPIGQATRRLTNAELRPLIEKSMREKTGADIAWINTGNVRDALPEGTILERYIWNILPFDNALVTGKFKGSQLPKTITDRYPVDPEKQYTVTTADFTMLNQAASDQLNTTGMDFPVAGPMQRDTFIEWVKQQKTLP